MTRRPPTSTPFPTRRSSDLVAPDMRFLCLTTARGKKDGAGPPARLLDRKSTRLNSSHTVISYAVFCLKKKKDTQRAQRRGGYDAAASIDTIRHHPPQRCRAG